jgi:spore germination cell wall hydrolase CwlJ-like protein
MAVSRKPRRRRWAPVAAGALVLVLMPSSVAFSDLGALLARQPSVAARAREHLIASPFGTIHAAMFSLPRPIGTAIPAPPVYALANFDPADITGSIGAEPLGDGSAPVQFPTVNRQAKRDSLISRARQPMPPPEDIANTAEPEAALKKDASRIDRFADYEFAELPPPGTAPDIDLPYADLPPTKLLGVGLPPGEPKESASVFFGARPLGPSREAIAPWQPGEAPVVQASRASGDPDIKQSALEPSKLLDNKEGQSIAPKGEVTGVDQRPKSPAERLALEGAKRAKAEKCLANAVYFEARGESVRGQIAVAQVVMNRVFSPFYPNDVCEVVYQNANRHNNCQFTFACDGIPDIVTEPDAYARAQRIARDMLDGKLWMPEVAKATHYHAYWVHPDWINEMKKIYKIGVHTFYRPITWGAGDEEPVWSDPATTEKHAAMEESMGPVSHSKEWLQSDEGQAELRAKAGK